MKDCESLQGLCMHMSAGLVKRTHACVPWEPQGTEGKKKSQVKEREAVPCLSLTAWPAANNPLFPAR